MANTRRSAGKVGVGFLVLCALVGGGTGFYFGYYLPNHRQVQEQQRKIEALEKVVARLKSERRIAEVALVGRVVEPTTGVPTLTLRFVEYDRAGREMPHRYLRAVGDEVYFDALVIKFDEDYVAAGDALRGQSIYLFRRVFGDKQAPETGDPIDGPSPDGSGIPGVYRIDDTTNPYERELWHNFWEYAQNPEAAKAQGVRVAQGEAAYTRIRPDRLYTLTIEADGGINIVAKPLPAALAPAG